MTGPRPPFEGSVALVTGAGRGLGRALGERLGAGGAAVAIADIDGDAAGEVAAGLAASGARALAVATDVSDTGSVERAVADVERALGRVDVLCACAGIGGPADVGAPDEQWRAEWEVNVMGCVRAARAVVPGMVARGGGRVLLVSSGAGLLTNAEALSYTASKHALVGAAMWLAARYGADGVRVSCFCPSGVLTDLFENGLTPRFRELLRPSAVTADDAARLALDGLAEGRLLTSTTPVVLDEFARFAADPDAWRTAAEGPARRLVEAADRRDR